MKKLTCILVCFLLAFGVFAKSEPEEQPPLSLSLAVEGDWDADGNPDTPQLYYAGYVAKEFTNLTGIDVKIVSVKSDDNTTKRLEAMIMAGLIPNVYSDYGGRVGLFTASRKDVFDGRVQAVALDEYLPERILVKYFPDYLAMFSHSGHVYALPLTSWAVVGHLNRTLVKQAGMEFILDDGIVTYDEVEAVTKKLGEGYYATSVFAKQSGGDYWIIDYWLAGHGARMYDENRNLVVNNPQAVAALTLMKRWYAEGLIPFGVVADGPGEFIANIEAKKLVSFTYGLDARPEEVRGWDNMHFRGVSLQGIEKIPVATGVDAVLAFKVDDEEKQRAAVKLVEHIASAKYQQFRVDVQQRFPSMFNINVKTGSPNHQIMVDNLEKNGVFDHGVGTAYYQEIRAEWLLMIQKILTGEESIEIALATMQENGNKIIAKYR